VKLGDICELSAAPGWYIWFKHKIQGPALSPMSLGRGCWILGVYSGATPAMALTHGESAEVIYYVRRKSALTPCGSLPVHPADITFPTFLMYRTDGQGQDVIFLCRGYDVLRQVLPVEIRNDIRFSFGLSVDGLADEIREGSFERLLARKRVHPLGEQSDGHQAKVKS
jgi:hypothetical protein